MYNHHKCPHIFYFDSQQNTKGKLLMHI